MLRRWRTLNGWTQYTAAQWAQEAGDFESAPHSGLSELENGHVKNPRSGTFIRLAEVNHRVHHADFHGVRSRKIKDELQGSRSIVDEQGKPWGPAQFWECHSGLLGVPAHLAPVPTTPAPDLTDDHASELSDSWRQAIYGAGRARKLSPMKACQDFLRGVPAQHREAVESGLLMDFTTADLLPLWDPIKGGWWVQAWVDSWLEA
jgi:transcriptional regulator with XRE-family HTH domain